jgi:predicted acyl esterase
LRVSDARVRISYVRVGIAAVGLFLVLGAPAQAAVTVERDLPLTMRDGVRLFADVRRPPGRVPSVLVLTPYNKNAIGTLLDVQGSARTFTDRGYAVVVVDVRGTGSSHGAWDSWGPAEQADTSDIARWLRAQPWSDGRFAMWGDSYHGWSAVLAAERRPPGLKAIFAGVTGADAYRDVTWHGGDANVAFLPAWFGIIGAGEVAPPGYGLTSGGDSLQLLADRLRGGGRYQLQAGLDGLLGGNLAYDNPDYALRSPGRRAGRIQVPTFLVGGWFDLFVRGTPRLYQRLRLPPGRKQLLMGPWTHELELRGDGTGYAGAPPRLDRLAADWFDRWLKGERNGIEDFGPVTVAELGAKRWVTAADWPRPGRRVKRLFLRQGGVLGARRPVSPARASTGPPLVDGLCSRSTFQWTIGAIPPGTPCETDDRLNEIGAVTFETAPLRRTLHLSGPAGLRLRAATSARDATWVARLTDVAPDGASEQLTAGWLVMSMRAVDSRRSRPTVPYHPFTRASVLPVEPGRAYDLAVEILNVDAVLARGHRLRLVLQTADVPHMLSPLPRQADKLGAVGTVLVDPEHPSRLAISELPDGP